MSLLGLKFNIVNIIISTLIPRPGISAEDWKRGNFWIRATLPTTISLQGRQHYVNRCAG